MNFIVQIDKNGIPTTDMGFNIIEACKYQNWYSGKSVNTVATEIRNDCITDILTGITTHMGMGNTIPVGTLEYVQNHMMKYQGIDKVKPLNIPIELREEEFTSRRIWNSDEKGIEELLCNFSYSSLFIKSNTKCKKCSKEVDITDTIEPDNYMVSQMISIEAEWRVFVFNRKVEDIRLYSGDFYETFDKAFIEKVINTYKVCPTAYTLDIGKTTEGKMVIIEVHNFISCGLYGFKSYSILPQMVSAAYKYEISHNNMGVK